MKRYLLDTHILLWWLADDKKLSAKNRKIISDPENQIYVSAATIWEIVIKKGLGKLEVPDNILDIIKESNVVLLSISADHAFYVKNLPNIHNDPFDRLLISQSNIEDFALITNDKLIKKYKCKCI